MKKHGKGFIAGVLTTLLVMSFGMTAFAAYQKQAILSYDNIKISLNGKEVVPTDANGNRVEPFMIDGTTYLPIRAIGSALGLDVGWEQVTKTATLKTNTTDTNTTPTTNPTGQVTTGKKNALSSAKNYLSITSFSYDGIVKQLEYEKYSHDEAVYAADNCGANWNEQAAKAAKNYLTITSFSRDGLIKQLQYDGFTQSQAEYGAKANGY